jgi:hypothetical protein
MKRTALLLAILAAFSITSVSQVCASPVVGEKAMTVSSWLSYYIANFLREHRHDFQSDVNSEDKLIIDRGDDVILGGDADDYANGRIDDGQDYDPLGPGRDKRDMGM